MRGNRRCSIFPPIAGCFAILAALLLPVSATAQDALEQELLDAWTERQAKIDSVIVEWTTVSRISESALTAFDDPGSQAFVAQATFDETNQNIREHEIPLPITDGFGTFEESHTLFIQGDRYRLESTGASPLNSAMQLVPFHRVTVSDGTHAQTLDDSLSIARWSIVTVWRHAPYNWLGMVAGSNGREIFHAVRPLEFPGLSYRPEGFQLDENPRLLDGERGIVIRAELGQSGNFRVRWIDPAKDYLIVYDTFESAQGPVSGGEISWEGESTFNSDLDLWLPSGTFLNRTVGVDGSISRDIESTINRCEINVDIPEDTFDLAVPPGAIIMDQRDTADGYEPQRHMALYFVRPDGSHRMITYAERFASYDLISRTETGEAVVDPPSRDD